MIKDGGAILGAHIGALAIEGGGIMDREEHIQQVAIGKNRRIKGDPYDFRVTGVPVAYGPIGGVLYVSAGITGLYALHTLEFIKNGLQTPETSPGQCCGLKMVAHDKFSF